MPGVVIRRMSLKDLDAVSVIEKQVFPDPWSYNAFETDLNNEMACPLVALFDDILAGYACLYIVAGEIQIGNFAVHPGFRKRGIAKVMMKEILRIAQSRNCDTIFLEVRESNKLAQSVYGAFGFEAVGLRDNYYRNPRENAVIMVKEL
jgi:ribosomal-protein-alanine N-acetyltransferase